MPDANLNVYVVQEGNCKKKGGRKIGVKPDQRQVGGLPAIPSLDGASFEVASVKKRGIKRKGTDKRGTIHLRKEIRPRPSSSLQPSLKTKGRPQGSLSDNKHTGYLHQSGQGKSSTRNLLAVKVKKVGERLGRNLRMKSSGLACQA